MPWSQLVHRAKWPFPGLCRFTLSRGAGICILRSDFSQHPESPRALRRASLQHPDRDLLIAPEGEREPS
eukprot:12832189-Alexandrium_andersonii.AAC.1